MLPTEVPAPSRLRRAHTLTGIVPLGLLVVVHAWINAHALYGRESYERVAAGVRDLPARPVLEVLLVLLPLAFHGLVGVVLAVRSRAPVAEATPLRRWLDLLQRGCGLLALVFVVVHVGQFRVPLLRDRLDVRTLLPQVATDLADLGWFVAYLVGVTAVVFHLAYGSWKAVARWRPAWSGTAVRRAAWCCGALGLLLWAAAVDPLFHFAYRCGGIMPWPGSQVAAACADPDAAANRPGR